MVLMQLSGLQGGYAGECIYNFLLTLNMPCECCKVKDFVF